MQPSPKQQSYPIFIGVFMWFIAAIFYGLDYLQHAIPSVLIEPISASMTMNYVDIANIMSVFFPVYAVSQIPAGRLIDRYGIKITMASACLVMNLGLLLMLVSSLPLIFCGRVLIAIGAAFAFIGTLKTISIWLPRKHFALFVGMTQTIGVIGGLLGQVLINKLIALAGWQQASLSVVVFGVVWSVIILLFLNNNAALKQYPSSVVVDAAPVNSGNPGNLLAIIANKQIWIIALYASIMVGAVMNTFAEIYDVLFLEKTLGISSQQAAEIAMFIFIGVGVGAPLHGMIANLFNRARTWLIICAFMTWLIFLLIPLSVFWSFSITELIIIYFLLGFFVSSMLLAFSIAKRCYPTQTHGMVFAVVNTIIGLVGFLFPVFFGESIKIIAHYIQLANELLPSLFLLSLLLFFNIMLSFFIPGDAARKFTIS